MPRTRWPICPSPKMTKGKHGPKKNKKVGTKRLTNVLKSVILNTVDGEHQ